MKWFDVILLVLIGAYCAYVIFAKRKGGCCGDCGKCKGCAREEKG